MNYFPVIIGLIPSFAWLIFYLKEDPHPEPKKLIFETFLAGAFSTTIVLAAQTLFNNWAGPRGIGAYTLISFLALAAIEEFFKFGAARVIIDKHPRDFDEPVDAMIYIIVAALGFALATVLHTAFNFLIIRFEPATVPTIFLIIAALFILYDFEKLKHLR